MPDVRRTSISRAVPLMAVSIALALFGAACGGGGSDSDYVEPKGPIVETVELESGNLYFKPKKLSVQAGIVKFEIDNKTGAHDFHIDQIDGFKIDLSSSGRHSGKAKLEAGTKYTFRCTIPGHAAAGMKGTITVE